MNAELLEETDSLLTLIEDIGRKPDSASANGNGLVDEIVNLVGEDWGYIIKEVWVRVMEFRERLGCLSFGEAVELVCELKRMEESKEMRKMVMEKSFWDVVRGVKEKADKEVHREEAKVYKTVSRHRACESDRFASPLLPSAELLRFPSGKFL